MVNRATDIPSEQSVSGGVARSCYRVPSISGHSDKINLAFNRLACARRIRNQYDFASAQSVPGKCSARRCYRLNTIVHASPNVAEDRVVLSGDFFETLDNRRHV